MGIKGINLFKIRFNPNLHSILVQSIILYIISSLLYVIIYINFIENLLILQKDTFLQFGESSIKLEKVGIVYPGKDHDLIYI